MNEKYLRRPVYIEDKIFKI